MNHDEDCPYNETGDIDDCICDGNEDSLDEDEDNDPVEVETDDE